MIKSPGCLLSSRSKEIVSKLILSEIFLKNLSSITNLVKFDKFFPTYSPILVEKVIADEKNIFSGEQIISIIQQIPSAKERALKVAMGGISKFLRLSIIDLPPNETNENYLNFIKTFPEEELAITFIGKINTGLLLHSFWDLLDIINDKLSLLIKDISDELTKIRKSNNPSQESHFLKRLRFYLKAYLQESTISNELKSVVLKLQNFLDQQYKFVSLKNTALLQYSANICSGTERIPKQLPKKARQMIDEELNTKPVIQTKTTHKLRVNAF